MYQNRNNLLTLFSFIVSHNQTISEHYLGTTKLDNQLIFFECNSHWSFSKYPTGTRIENLLTLFGFIAQPHQIISKNHVGAMQTRQSVHTLHVQLTQDNH